MTAAAATRALSDLVERARRAVVARVVDQGSGRIVASRLTGAQLAAHALAWLATEARAAQELDAWASATGVDLDRRIADAYAGALVSTLRGGVALGPCERVGLGEIGLDDAAVAHTFGALSAWAEHAASGDSVVSLAHEAFERGSSGSTNVGTPGADEDTLAAMRAQMRAFAAREVAPIAQDLHRRDALVPLELIASMAELGLFALTVPRAHGGQGLGKIAMCVVTEELARASLVVASVATRSEIASELLLTGGTDAQRGAFLSRIASGDILPTAVFTEPDHGSDLARVTCRAERLPDGSWSVHGQKTWATHAARGDLMTLLVRVVPGSTDHDGLGILLAPKQRALPGRDFPDEGLSGTEIPVIGYRGLKEYELSFDGFRAPADALLGGEPGRGFRQLMETFETARIQTAARAVGVAQSALDEATRYGHERSAFGAPLATFPRISFKLGRMIVQTMAARRLAYAAARAKDQGRRADLDAGMAKLFAARAAWEAADACVQIHGGAGYAEESVASRLLVDARVLSLFEGTSEIQAQVIARRLLEPS